MKDETAVTLTLRIAGHLQPRWQEWFAGLTMHHLPDGSTELSGRVADQAALYGLLNRARDLGLTLLSVVAETAVVTGQADEPD
jgi:hypothetical protein